MTQFEKEILLRDLCSRLPFGVKAEKYTIRMDGEFVPLASAETVTAKDIISQGELPGYVVKPYLFPLSSMTEEQREEYYGTFSLSGDISGSVDFYNKYHFDYRGLIPLGLANDATNKNIY